MFNLRLLLQYIFIFSLELLKQPSYIVSTIAFPALFYCVFALPEITDTKGANLLMTSFCAFGVIGVVFLQFGVGVAQEKNNTWFLYIKTLPAPDSYVLLARIFSSILFSLMTITLIMLIGVYFSPVSLSLPQWFTLILYLIIGSVSFSLMGLCLGQWSPPKAALPIANLIYLPLSFAGGLWKPPWVLPENIQVISNYLPTRHYGEILWAISRTESAHLKHWLYLLAYGLFFLILALWGYKHQQKQTYGTT